MTRQTTVYLHGCAYRVTYGATGAATGVVIGVEQQIIPLRAKMHWRALHPTSRAWKAAVEAANRKPPKP